ncbi:MutS family DNA mismatch repair protein [Parabacteroides sp. PF5-6]|uniref:MutS family DNA mismatch repair protein n=1 Tax=Parabacteroides sp. PF5-6 TaxID=1742403 RepID=UPI00240588BA|nr:MutS family DNA mismatch repair protein [Parabacteroides sp. PF5-6]
MKNIYSYYKEKVRLHQEKAEQLRKVIHLIGTVRLAIVAATVATLWVCREENWPWWLAILVLYCIPFAALMLYHNRLSKQKNYAEAMINLNVNELKALDYDFSAFDGAAEKSSAEHSFSLDLDLFGERSLFQSINRTVTEQGKDTLADGFRMPLTQKPEILKRQEAIRELAGMTALRQHFYVTGTRKTSNKKDSADLNALTEGQYYFLRSRFWKVMMVLIPVFWVVILAGFAFDRISGGMVGLFFAVSFVLANVTGRQVNQLYQTVNKMEKIFATYADLMRIIETSSFQSEALQTITHQLTGEKGITASRAIKQLSGYIGGLDQRYSAAGILLNIFYLRDTRHAFCLERWKAQHKEQITGWIDALARFDAYSSLGGFAFNHPDYIYPTIADAYFKMEGKALGHPLLHRDKCVCNAIDIRKSPRFLVITGANMAGKSTYLRTVGVNYILACIGAPVFAESLTIYPAHLVTSLRTSDSLVSNESYFFAELKRLKMIIDRLKDGQELFIILDEILKGTNSVDKQKGSLALMKQLVHFNTCGIIATHDLVLGSLEEEFPHEIKNFRFEADIKENELSFSYTLREGIAQNMNASFLMKKMGITV